MGVRRISIILEILLSLSSDGDNGGGLFLHARERVLQDLLALLRFLERVQLSMRLVVFLVKELVLAWEAFFDLGVLLSAMLPAVYEKGFHFKF